MKIKTLYLPVGLSLVLAGCMVNGKDFQALRKEVQSQQTQITDLKVRQQEQSVKIEALNNGFKIIGTRVDENGRRMDDFERAAPAGGASGALPAPAVPDSIEVSELPPEPEPPPPTVDEEPPAVREDAEALYSGALDAFSAGDYRKAVLGFEEFVANYPDHHLADNAQYWIGECYYTQKNFSRAVIEFGKVEEHFPGGNKVAAALLKKGLALSELGRKEEARATVEKVSSQWPDSEEAVKAAKVLSRFE